MSDALHGWIHVWIPAQLRSVGIWTVEVGAAVGAPDVPVAAPPFMQDVRLSARGVFGARPFALTLTLPVWVEPGRTTEVHLPASLLPLAHAASGP